MAVGLILGPIQFVDREVPDSITFGGKQILAKHINIGGSRVIDAMGPEPSNIDWSGRLLTLPNLGLSADARCRQLDSLRQSGLQVLLIWPGFAYQVVVEHFAANYKHKWEIGYQISCCVISDAWQLQIPATLTQAINNDIVSLRALAS